MRIALMQEHGLAQLHGEIELVPERRRAAPSRGEKLRK